MTIQTLPKSIICPQLGTKPQRSTLCEARRTFNGQRWRTDMREAMAVRDWDKITWLEKYYEPILSA